MSNPEKALKNGAKIVTSAVSENCKAPLVTIPGVLNFYHTRKCLHRGNFVQIQI